MSKIKPGVMVMLLAGEASGAIGIVDCPAKVAGSDSEAWEVGFEREVFGLHIDDHSIRVKTYKLRCFASHLMVIPSDPIAQHNSALVRPAHGGFPELLNQGLHRLNERTA